MPYAPPLRIKNEKSKRKKRNGIKWNALNVLMEYNRTKWNFLAEQIEPNGIKWN